MRQTVTPYLTLEPAVTNLFTHPYVSLWITLIYCSHLGYSMTCCHHLAYPDFNLPWPCLLWLMLCKSLVYSGTWFYDLSTTGIHCRHLTPPQASTSVRPSVATWLMLKVLFTLACSAVFVTSSLTLKFAGNLLLLPDVCWHAVKFYKEPPTTTWLTVGLNAHSRTIKQFSAWSSGFS